MQLREIIDRLELTLLSSGGDVGTEVTGGYCGDLLSHVLANAKPGTLWITIQQHANVFAVAHITMLAGVLLADGVRPNGAVLEKACADGIVVLSSQDSAFTLAGRLYRFLVDST